MTESAEFDVGTSAHGHPKPAGVGLKLILVAALVTSIAVAAAQVPVALADPSEGFIDDVPSATPSTLGDLDLTELRYGDPTEGVALVQPPDANVEGSADLAHPLPVPPGRAGVQPDLALTYDSGAGSSWVGTGWDVGVGAVTVDTEYGAPRYLSAEESETYVLDGDRLFPNAIRTDLEPRVAGPKADFTRQLEDDYDLIVRHGDSPDDYCWQVVDTDGNQRWYGGEPDGSGGCTRDASAILQAAATGIAGGGAGDFHWALTYVEDISGNTMHFSYDKDTAVAFGQQAESAFGASLYLDQITYTGFANPGPGTTAVDRPAYRVSFLRDGDVTGATARLDVNVDASAGLAVVTADLLRRVEVHYLSPAFYDSGAAAQLVKGWTLEYENGPYDKSLLTRVGQFGSDGSGTEHAWHEFAWFDEVTDGSGAYTGFGTVEEWGSGNVSDNVNIAAESALGTSWRAGGDGSLYVGFNPVVPSKLGSFGGSFTIAGGQSNETSTLVDLDGDSLPDKVWVSGGTVHYRPNLRRPGTTEADRHTDGSWFGPTSTITGIDGLGKASDIRIDLHVEAYPVVAIQVGGGFGFSFGDQYFSDANGDGRVDFIQPGSSGGQTVYYNVLDNGVPKFIDSSLANQLVDTLEVPLDDLSSALADAAIDGVSDLLVNTSPRIDTVRRWIAPHTGTIQVDGTVSLTTGANYGGDGAQVSIEYGGGKQWEATLDAASDSASHDGTEIGVTAGQPVWFRLHVIDNASDDEVSWSPVVTYLTGSGGSALTADVDANNRSQVVFDSDADFTLFGRTGARTAFTEDEDIDVTVTIETTAALSDDLDVVVLHGRGDSIKASYDLFTVNQLTVGAQAGTQTLDIEPPATSGDTEVNDWVEVHVLSDSPVDPTAVSVDIVTTASTPEQPPELGDIDPDADVDIPLDVPIVPNVRVFARTDRTAPYAPATSPNQDRLNSSTFEVTVQGAAIDGGNAAIDSTAVLTVKSIADAVVARQEFTVEHFAIGPVTFLGGTASVDFTPEQDTDYYFDVSIHEPVVGANVGLTQSRVTWRWTETEQDSNGDDVDVDKSSVVNNVGQMHWPDADGLFPSGNRGWAYAGYNADHADADGGNALVESQFRFSAESAGFDEDTDVPDVNDVGSAGDVRGNVGDNFEPAFPYIPWGDTGADVADRWRAAEKETLNGRAAAMQSDRLGADTPAPGLSTSGRAAPQMLSVDGDFHFMLGLVVSFTAAAGGGRALRDYDDYNGDGYPDIRSEGDIEYTGPRGALAGTTDAGDNSFDTALAVGGGIGGSAISVSSDGNSTPNNDGGAGPTANVSPTSSKPSRGMNIGLGFDISAQWTNPIANGEAFDEVDDGNADNPDIQGDLDTDRGSIPTAAGSTGTIMDRAFIDLNGDGLPDRVDTYTSGELWVNLNLGYRFAPDAVQWSTGRTESDKDVSGSLSVGFELNAYEFAGGVGYNEGVGYSLFDWMDIDGDGVPDRMNNVGDGQPRTVFGSADGMLRSEVVYGTYPDGNVAVDAARFGDDELPGVALPAGQMEVSRNTGLSGGFDFTFYIGPICLVACYVVINPGAHGSYDRTVSQIQLEDMNGDGYLDAVRSTDFENIEVRLNLRGRTNLLQAVTNPLGGQIRLDYERDGNTIANPESLWLMSSIEVDDGRSGDGPDVQRSEFTYSGNAFDPLLRELMGFSLVREDQVDTSGAVLRSFERDYLNGNPFETGVLTEERTYDENGDLRERAEFSWIFVDADPQSTSFGDQVVGLPALGTTARTLLFDVAISPRLATDRLTRVDTEGDAQTVATRYTYDDIGNALTVHDENEDEIDGDDTFTVLTYPACAASRAGDRILAAGETWTSVPQTVTVYGNDAASGEVLKHRNGGPSLCGNAVPIRIAQLVGTDPTCGDLYAITELGFDDYGSYNSMVRPTVELPSSCADYPPETVAAADVTFDGCATLTAADDAARSCVDYLYDDHRFTDVASVTDNHGVGASATYDPDTGRLASRTDEAGNLTSYTYDAQGRISTIVAPKEQGTGNATLTYGYGALDATLDPAGAHTWSTVAHFDRFNTVNTIDTVTFVDGMGRVVQRKRDAEVEGTTGEARIVEGAVEYDALGREVREWYPVVEGVSVQPLTTYNTWSSETGTATTGVPETTPTVRVFDALDRLRQQTLPDGSVETIAYDVDVLPNSLAVYGADIAMTRSITTDPLGKEVSRWLDVGGAIFRVAESPAGANDPDGGTDPLGALPTADAIQAARIADSTSTVGDIATDYEYDRLGRLTAVVDVAGARTEHTYNLLDAITSTDTPDAGLVQRTYAPSGQLLTQTRATGATASYLHDRERIVGVDYSDDTPDITYEYGAPAAAENAAGRVTRVVDGSMDRTYGYDEDGNVVRESATQDPQPFSTGTNQSPPTWTTGWDYDSLGRIADLTYPDGEVLSYDYDLGGRPERLVSQAPQHDLYDQFGNAVPRPDAEIVYVDAIRYDQFGQPSFLRTGTGVETNYEREPTRRFLAGVQTDVTAALQYDGSTSTARPLQDLEYVYDAVGNVRDAYNALYEDAADTVITEVGPPPVNNVPGPSQHAYTYDGFYRLTGGVGTYIDRKENRDFTYSTDYAPNGNLQSKAQETITTGTTGNGGGNGGGNGSGNKKKNPGGGGGSGEPTCESDTGSGGGSFNQDPETTYTYADGDLVYATDGNGNTIHRLVSVADREYTYDASGNMSGWVQPCAQGNGSDISRTFEWDAENRVVRIAEGNNDTEYRYNAEGQRTLERGPGGTNWFVNEHWRTFNQGHRYALIYVGEEMIASHRTSPPDDAPPPCDPAVETCTCDEDTACVVVDQSECDASRVFDPATSTCQPAEERTIHFFHLDLQGSMRVATDEVGVVFQYMDYLPTGRPWVAGQSTTKDTPYLFAGGWTDMTYDYVNFGDRWFDPREENFISPEPLLEESPYAVVDTPSLLSAYTYAASNPLRFADPDGRAPHPVTGFELGDNYENHERGNITISVERRNARPAPAITFRGRYSNNASGQAIAEKFEKFDDRVSAFTTILTVTIENGERQYQLFGFPIKRENKAPGEGVAPNPGPNDSGAPEDDRPLAAPAPQGAPQQADARDPAGDGGPAAAGGARGDPVDDGAGPPVAPPVQDGNGDQDAPPPPPERPPPPLPASPAADGPDG